MCYSIRLRLSKYYAGPIENGRGVTEVPFLHPGRSGRGRRVDKSNGTKRTPVWSIPPVHGRSSSKPGLNRLGLVIDQVFTVCSPLGRARQHGTGSINQQPRLHGETSSAARLNDSLTKAPGILSGP